MGSPEQQENILSDEEWYDTARAKVNSFIYRLDPHLRVGVESVTVQSGKNQHDTLALSFESEKDSNMKWTMEISKNNDYIENKLENVVRNIYNKRSGRKTGG